MYWHFLTFPKYQKWKFCAKFEFLIFTPTPSEEGTKRSLYTKIILCTKRVFYIKCTFYNKSLFCTESAFCPKKCTLSLTLLDPGGDALSAQIHFILWLMFFVSRKRVFLLFHFYYIGVRQFLVKNKLKIFYPTPLRGGTKKMKKI